MRINTQTERDMYIKRGKGRTDTSTNEVIVKGKTLSEGRQAGKMFHSCFL